MHIYITYSRPQHHVYILTFWTPDASHLATAAAVGAQVKQDDDVVADVHCLYRQHLHLVSARRHALGRQVFCLCSVHEGAVWMLGINLFWGDVWAVDGL